MLCKSYMLYKPTTTADDNKNLYYVQWKVTTKHKWNGGRQKSDDYNDVDGSVDVV